MPQDLQSRIDAMYGSDRLWALGFVIVLWIVVLYVMLSIGPHIPNENFKTACWVAAGILLLFNTASIFAMIRHYSQDKEHIYGLDIKHLDAGR